MWPTRAGRQTQIEDALAVFSQEDTPLMGIEDPRARQTLAMQMIASLRRLDYTAALKSRDIHPDRADPESPLFDPERAAILHARTGNVDEAIWLIFLSIHFGKHGKHGWKRLRDVYSGLGTGMLTWRRVSADPRSFRKWLKKHHNRIGGGFGNHRKYETLNPGSESSTATVIESFVDVMSPSPSGYFSALAREVGNDPKRIFDAAYRRLAIKRFGRLAKFDFLCLLGRLDFAPLEPGSAYLRGSTGPLKGARLLVDGSRSSTTTSNDLEAIIERLDSMLSVGMQVMEDALCNWQKSPQRFIHFRG
jgi:alpha-glutamyl/putrescinyl thymine pyrophosphorylase-like protein